MTHLSRVVQQVVWSQATVNAERRGQKNYTSCPILRYVWQSLLGEEVRSLDIDSESFVEIFLSCALKIFIWRDTSIRHDYVNFLELGNCSLDNGLDTSERSGIGFDGKGFRFATNFFDNLFRSCTVRRVVDGDKRALSCEQLGCCGANTLYVALA